MSSRSRDLISATLISAGIICAGEVHLACNTGTAGTAFRDYWTDWFDNDRWHDTVSSGEAAMTAGRNDVLLVGLGSNDVTGTITWNLANTHMVGAGAVQMGRPQSRLQLAGTGAVTPMVNVTATGCCFSNLTWRHGRDANANAGCLTALQISTGAGDFVARNCFFWGPEDATVAASTGGYSLVRVNDHSEFYHCLFGYGWPMNMAPSESSKCASLVRFAKSVFNSSVFEYCNFVYETTAGLAHFLHYDYSPAGGTYWVYKNCAFIQASTTSVAVALFSPQSALFAAGQKNAIYFDANSYFVGVTDVSYANSESWVWFSPAQLASTGTGDRALKVGLAQNYDHTE